PTVSFQFPKIDDSFLFLHFHLPFLHYFSVEKCPVTSWHRGTGFQAHLIKSFLRESQTLKSIPFIVSGSVDRYYHSNKNVRYMKSSYESAYIVNNSKIANSKWEFWCREKIIVAGMTKVIEATYSIEPLALGVGIYGIKNTNQFKMKCILALLNSKYLTYYLQINFRDKHLAGGYLAINKSTLESLPLVDINDNIQNILSNFTSQILSAKKFGQDTQNLEDQIDLMVYKLYELTFEEAKIVDPKLDSVLAQFGLSRTDYERMGVQDFAALNLPNG
ncbi:MAG: TaqI-like C-terminal specificity domain-containing protein, partial [Candidatus Cloacimonadales bacterium]|nr:TaqI-like C-terminal specificity domain-containing protein [Candidatus Cloacimonadales bacterium]